MTITSPSGRPRMNTVRRACSCRAEPRKAATASASASTLSAASAASRAAITASARSGARAAAVVRSAGAPGVGAALRRRSSVSVSRFCGASSKQSATPASRQKASRLSTRAEGEGASTDATIGEADRIH